MDVVKISESSACNSICSLVIPNYLLDDWYSSRGSGNSFVRRLNDSIVGRALMIKECDTIESRLKVNACKVHHKIKRATKRAKQALKMKTCELTVFNGETEDTRELYDDWLYSIDDYK